KINLRIIVATHRNLQDQVRKGRFREDLYYRLLGLPIHLPPLRDRGNDIILIANHFIEQFCQENHLPKKYLDVESKKTLMFYSFPGNIRELRSIVELACVMSNTDEISHEHIQIHTHNNKSFNANTETLTLKQFTTQLLQHYLDTYEYDVLKVAEKLDIGKSTIYRMISNNELKLNKHAEEQHQ
ncbi:MAG: sigma 54-interacting transcriptional regulator, partial [Panacibacter sp.]